jgi:succinoglycan biosynthesis protein ExoO
MEREDMADQRALSVSVVIPAYDAESFIGRAIEWALNQTLSPLDIIVADDALSDSTCEAVV